MEIVDHVFDLDGTLVDSVPGVDAAVRQACREAGLAGVIPSMRSYIGPPIRVMLGKALDTQDAALLERLEKSFRHHYDNDAWKATTPYPGVDETLRLLRSMGGRLCLLTNKPRLPTVRILAHLGWAALFDIVITPDTAGFQYSRKEEASVAMSKQLKLVGSETLLVGDSEDDWTAARAAGFHFAAAAWGYGGAGKLTSVDQIKSFQEILNLSIRNS